MNEILVLSTADSLELAKKIAFALIEEREAGCVNIVPGIRSIYRWEGRVNEDEEFLLLIKSTDVRFEAIRARICLLHSYKTPEVIALSITAGDFNYLNWLHASISNSSILPE
jgi:periplasmic divalent cation tolerance protein